MSKGVQNQNDRISAAVGAAFGLIAAYVFAANAFDTASYWQYLGSIVFLILAVKLLARSLKSNGKV